MGNIKEFIPDEMQLELETPVSLSELKVIAGIPKERNVSFVVNGRVQKGGYTVSDHDDVKFLMLVGAG